MRQTSGIPGATALHSTRPLEYSATAADHARAPPRSTPTMGRPWRSGTSLAIILSHWGPLEIPACDPCLGALATAQEAQQSHVLDLQRGTEALDQDYAWEGDKVVAFPIRGVNEGILARGRPALREPQRAYLAGLLDGDSRTPHHSSGSGARGGTSMTFTAPMDDSLETMVQIRTDKLGP